MGLINLLGGYTRQEYAQLEASLEAWRTRATAAETTVALFKEIMTREQVRADRLEKDLREQVNGPEYKPQQAPDMQPVGDRKVSSWPRMKREMERLHRVNDNAGVSRKEVEKEIREGQ